MQSAAAADVAEIARKRAAEFVRAVRIRVASSVRHALLPPRRLKRPPPTLPPPYRCSLNGDIRVLEDGRTTLRVRGDVDKRRVTCGTSNPSIYHTIPRRQVTRLPSLSRCRCTQRWEQNRNRTELELICQNVKMLLCFS